MVKDVLNREIREEDIVIRAKYSSFVFHKVLGFTGKNIILSCKTQTATRYWSNVQYPARKDSYDVQDIQNHNNKFYFPKNWAKAGLILAF